MISEAHHGFVKGRSTITSLMISQNLSLAKWRKGGRFMQCDFSKDFNKVNQGLLLSYLGSRLVYRAQLIAKFSFLNC
jgi:hypothetical protein